MADVIEAREVTGFWVKVEDGEVLEVWDSQPGEDEMATGLWSAAVEKYPEMTSGREGLTGHTIDITQTPIEIVYSKMSVEVDNRVDTAKYNAQLSYKGIVEEESERVLSGGTTDLDRIAAAQTLMDQQITALDAVTTHDEYEALDLTFDV